MRCIYVFISLLIVLAFASVGLLAQADTPARGGVPRQPLSQEASAELAKGQELLYSKDIKGGIASFKKVVELQPSYVRGYLLLGNAYMQAQQWQDAQSAFETAARLEPENAIALLGVGAALNQQEDWSGALKPLQQSLKIKADSAEAQYELARSLTALGRLQDAEIHVRMSVSFNSKYAVPHILMGDIYLHLYDNAEAALAEYETYLRLDPDGPSAAPVKEMIARLKKLMS
jgi:tetratricopeptide (TPR) repeat protein